MDLYSMLAAVPVAGPVLPYVPAAIAAGAVAARFMPPPAQPKGWYAVLYMLVNALGQNGGHATNAAAVSTPEKKD